MERVSQATRISAQKRLDGDRLHPNPTFFFARSMWVSPSCSGWFREAYHMIIYDIICCHWCFGRLLGIQPGWWFGCHEFSFSHILGISSSQLTKSYFSEGWPRPPTSLGIQLFAFIFFYIEQPNNPRTCMTSDDLTWWAPEVLQVLQGWPPSWRKLAKTTYRFVL